MAKDNAGATGASPYLPPFYMEMEEIFGNSPIHTKSESISIGATTIDIESDASVSQPTSPDTPSSTSAFLFPSIIASNEAATTTSFASSSIASAPVPAVISKPRQNRKMSKSDYFKAKLEQRERLELKRKALQEKQERFERKENLFKQYFSK